jgi:hypothetical protein
LTVRTIGYILYLVVRTWERQAMPEKTKRFFVRIDPDLHQAAHARAAKQGHTLSDVIRALLIWWIKSGKDVKDLEK